jgi:hypothetical protein
LATEDALAAARYHSTTGTEAICLSVGGGVAMHLYGFARATQDVDMLAERLPQLTPKPPLSFGGQSYTVPTGEKEVRVDFIVRDDFFRYLERSGSASGLGFLTTC